MQDLEIIWPEGVARFSPDDSPVQVGRSSSAAVPLTEGSVSRRHLELAWGGDHWTVSDNSTHGTFDTGGVRLAPRWSLAEDIVLRLGGIKGVVVEFRPVENSNGSALAGLSAAEAAPPVLQPEAQQPSRPADLFPSEPAPSAAPSAPASGSDPLFAQRRPQPAQASRPEPKLGSALGSDASESDFGQQAPAGRAASASEVMANRARPSLLSEGHSDDSPLSDSLLSRSPVSESEPPISPAGLSPDGPLQAPAPAAFDPASAPPPPGPAASPAPSADSPVGGGISIGDRPPVGPSGGSVFDAPPPPPPAPSANPTPTKPSAGPGSGPLSRPAPGPGSDSSSPDGSAPGATGGMPAVRLGPNSTVISDAAIRVNVDGQDYSFLPGAEVSVGRDPNCLIHIEEQHSLVSRNHLRMTYDQGSWWIEDFSSKGTFIDGKRLSAPYKAEGAFIVNLGDDDAGTPMRVIAAGEHRAPRQLNLLAVAALAAIALIPLILLAVLLTRGDSPSTEPDFETAKRATVMLFGLEGGQGSGFFVDDNLIVTNQHVAALSPQMLVGVSRQTDEPAQIEYATELVRNHPFLDIAVLRISNKATMTAAGPEISSEAVGDVGLPSVAIGDSNSIIIGDEVFSTGFPDRLSITSRDNSGQLRLPPVAATSGQAASFTIWPGCSNPDFEAFIPVESPPGVACSSGGDVGKGVLRSTFSSGQGASGSAVFRNNEVVAVVYAGDADDPNTSLNITTAAFAPWLEDIIASNP